MRRHSRLDYITGRLFYKIVGRFPLVSVILCLGGIFAGYCAIFVLHDNLPAKEWVLRVIGLLWIIGYSTFLIIVIYKIINGSWKAYCDKQIAISEEMLRK